MSRFPICCHHTNNVEEAFIKYIFYAKQSETIDMVKDDINDPGAAPLFFSFSFDGRLKMNCLKFQHCEKVLLQMTINSHHPVP